MGLSTRDLESESDADRGYGFKDNFTSTRLRSVFELHASVLPEIQSSSTMHIVCVVWIVREITLNLDRGSRFNESSFSVRVESPNNLLPSLKLI